MTTTETFDRDIVATGTDDLTLAEEPFGTHVRNDDPDYAQLVTLALDARGHAAYLGSRGVTSIYDGSRVGKKTLRVTWFRD